MLKTTEFLSLLDEQEIDMQKLLVSLDEQIFEAVLSGKPIKDIEDLRILKTTVETKIRASHSFVPVPWSTGTDEGIVAMVAAADAGKINLADYWAVGDTRTVHLSAMEATGVGESHTEQDVELVLMHAGEYKLNSAVESGRDTCSFVVGMKDCLNEAGYMNSVDTNSGSWDACARRDWCNSVFKDAIPTSLLPIFKQFKTITAETYNGTTLKTSVDWFALPAEREIFGTMYKYNDDGFVCDTEATSADMFQFDWYKTAANRTKKHNGSAYAWWERSPYYGNSNGFCLVYNDGDAYGSLASRALGLSVFGCV